LKNILPAVKVYFSKNDIFLFCVSVCACTMGLVFISSATRSYYNPRYMQVQIAASVIGIIGMLIFSRISYERLSELTPAIYILCILLLLWVIFFGTGGEETGNNSWIRFGGIGLQPSELVKIGFCITFASHLVMEKKRINSPLAIVRLALHAGVLLALIFAQGDVGTMLVFVVMAIAMCFSAGLSVWYFVGGAALFVCAMPFIWEHLLKDYHKMRILVVMYPELDPAKYGYQAIQCQTAIGSGQIFGNGLYNGTLTQYGLIPAKHTDCIFAVIGEEGGFLACSLVIALLSVIIIRCLHISIKASDDIGQIICTGVAAMFLFQSFENIGMCLGFLPVIGITLPFFSYGGTSVMTMFWAVGLVSSVYYHRKKNMFEA